MFKRCFSSANYEFIQTVVKGRVGVVTLHRPRALNALCDGLFRELNAALHSFDSDENIGALLLTGSEKAFGNLKIKSSG